MLRRMQNPDGDDTLAKIAQTYQDAGFVVALPKDFDENMFELPGTDPNEVFKEFEKTLRDMTTDDLGLTLDDEELSKELTDALRDPPVHLTMHDEWIDHVPEVIHRHEIDQCDHAGGFGLALAQRIHINDAAAHLKCPGGVMILVLDPHLAVTALTQQGPFHLWRRQHMLVHLRCCGVQFFQVG